MWLNDDSTVLMTSQLLLGRKSVGAILKIFHTLSFLPLKAQQSTVQFQVMYILQRYMIHNFKVSDQKQVVTCQLELNNTEIQKTNKNCRISRRNGRLFFSNDPQRVVMEDLQDRLWLCHMESPPTFQLKTAVSGICLHAHYRTPPSI